MLWSAVAGFGMVIWIVAEIGFIHTLMWAQMRITGRTVGTAPHPGT